MTLLQFDDLTKIILEKIPQDNIPSKQELNECVFNSIKQMFFNYLKNNKPSWEQYMILMAKTTASRSKDPNTQCGAVITDQDFRVVSTGYNGSFQNVNDEQIPTTRPEKYPYFIHAEENAILFAKKDLKNCLIFITGFPCHKCMRMIIQSGIAKVYYGQQKINMIDENELKLTQHFSNLKNVPLIPVDY